MPEPLKLPIRRIKTTAEEAVPSTWQLTIEFGTPTIPSEIKVLPRVRDEFGEWDNDVEDIPHSQIRDDLSLPEAHPARKIATLAGLWILDAIVQDGPFKGLSVRDMGAEMIRQQNAAQAAQDEMAEKLMGALDDGMGKRDV